ncbi:hypothetical protein BRADI_3g36005v3 [Brachypodium distachyon]|uniref:Uncharacterized protein n=1 Tax=Brachypodium distachyon TaxID=15368 RepID=A0A0Q3FJI9_BRADI|nr:hypothetical protein BRADI_3g36005v3 [Brachypodium distachyon]
MAIGAVDQRSDGRGLSGLPRVPATFSGDGAARAAAARGAPATRATRGWPGSAQRGTAETGTGSWTKNVGARVRRSARERETERGRPLRRCLTATSSERGKTAADGASTARNRGGLAAFERGRAGGKERWGRGLYRDALGAARTGRSEGIAAETARGGENGKHAGIAAPSIGEEGPDRRAPPVSGPGTRAGGPGGSGAVGRGRSGPSSSSPPPAPPCAAADQEEGRRGGGQSRVARAPARGGSRGQRSQWPDDGAGAAAMVEVGVGGGQRKNMKAGSKKKKTRGLMKKM